MSISVGVCHLGLPRADPETKTWCTWFWGGWSQEAGMREGQVRQDRELDPDSSGGVDGQVTPVVHGTRSCWHLWDPPWSKPQKFSPRPEEPEVPAPQLPALVG